MLNKKRSSIYEKLGFTLIELMITIAIIGILASIVYPSYTASVARSNRTEAQRELLRLANLQEQFYSDNRAYTTDMKNLGSAVSGSFTTGSGHYNIVSTVINATFKLTATAQGSQASADPNCTTLSIDQTGKKTAQSTNCWEH